MFRFILIVIIGYAVLSFMTFTGFLESPYFDGLHSFYSSLKLDELVSKVDDVKDTADSLSKVQKTTDSK